MGLETPLFCFSEFFVIYVCVSVCVLFLCFDDVSLFPFVGPVCKLEFVIRQLCFYSMYIICHGTNPFSFTCSLLLYFFLFLHIVLHFISLLYI